MGPEKYKKGVLKNAGPCIETATGIYFNFNDPVVEDISILDIAHSLSNQCRFTGHTSEFYSVAEHSMLVAKLVKEPELKLCALLHDATEAYLTDIATPVKAFMGNYRDMEAVLWEAISARFNLPKVLPDEIKWADKLALYIEARNLIPSGAEEWEDYQEMSEHIGDTPLACLAPKSARMLFLASYNNYGGMPHYNLNSLVHETHRSIIGSEYASVA